MRKIYTLELLIPEKISSNKVYSGLHWSKRNKLKDLYHSMLLPYKNKIKIEHFPVRITYSFSWKGILLDTTNNFFMIKMIEDGMVENKILPDDSPKYVHETVSCSVKGDKDIVMITIESL